jgi:hypothetical protein
MMLLPKPGGERQKQKSDFYVYTKQWKAHVSVLPATPSAQAETWLVFPIERTSFAEKDEPKGFCEISFAPNHTGAWGIKMLRFKDLPARPMVDIEIDPDVGSEGLIDYLINKISSIHKDSIVRLGSKGQLSEEIRGRLTAKFLRSVFPSSMNVELRNNLFNPSYEEITDGRQ